MWGQITDKKSIIRYLFVKKFIEYDPQMSIKKSADFIFLKHKKEKNNV